MPEFINGPINYAYLKGEINGIEKNIYLFMDQHYQLYNQTRCKSFNSVDITYYLYNIIKNTKEELDLFVEIRQEEIIKPQTNNKDIYIVEVENLFKSEFVEEKIENNKTVVYSKTNPKVRLHYLDIRDHLGLFEVKTKLITNGIEKNFKLLQNDINNKQQYIDKILIDLDKLEENIQIFKNNVVEILKIININNEKNFLYDKNDEKQKYYLNKSLNIYFYENLRINIYLFVCENYFFISSKLEGVIKDLKSNLSFSNLFNININSTEINKLIEAVHELTIDIYSLFTDVYLLRRILDKNEIKKCIIYSGIQHSLNYIYFLIKYYNFEIVKIYHTEEKDINIIVNTIKNSKIVYDIYKLFFNTRKKYIQCIDFEFLLQAENKIKNIF